MTTSMDAAKGSEITLSLRDHGITFTIPFGARMEGKLLLPGGALIHGDFIGDLYCETGAVLIMPGARFSGQLEADEIYIQGEVLPVAGNKRSILVARTLVAASESSRINADVYSPSFGLHKAKIWGTLNTLEEASEVRKSNRANAEPVRPAPALVD